MADPRHVPTLGGDPLLGKTLQDRYRIRRKLGEGGMGVVYEGEHIELGRRVAIKVLHPRHASRESILQRFRNEAVAASSLGHPHIVQVLDLGRLDDGGLFMALELLKGRDLGEVVELDGPLSAGRVVRIATQICDALSAVHQRDIVHRDLKAENVFLVEGAAEPDFVKLLDFGIAKFKDLDHRLTETGATLGTPYYMAPEQARSARAVDHRADLYSLGVLVYYALTCQPPFDDESFPSLVLKICNDPPPPLRELRPDLPEALEKVIDRMLAKRPEDRFFSAGEVAAALAPFSALDEEPPAEVVGHVRAHRPSRADTVAGPGGGEGEATGAGIRASQADRDAAGLGPRRRWGWLVAAVVLLVGSVAFGWSAWERDAELADATMPAPEAVPEPESSEVSSEPEDQRPEAPGATTVRVQIETDPPGAALYLDGDRVANPFDADLPRTAEPRRLEARLEGHTTVVQDLTLRFPQRIRIELASGGGVDDQRPAARRRAVSREATRRAPTAARQEEEPSTVRAETAASVSGSDAPAEQGPGEPRSAEEQASGNAPATLKRVRF